MRGIHVTFWRLVSILFCLILFPLPLPAETVQPLSLIDAVRMTIENNLDVRAEWYNPAQLEADIKGYRALYAPKISIGAGVDDATDAEPRTDGRIVGTRDVFLQTSLSRLLPSGAIAAVTLNGTYTETNSPSLLHHYRQSGLWISIRQPLLKDLGKEITEANIRASQFSIDAAMERLKTKILDSVAQVRSDYFKLYRLREELAVRRASLELAETILRETRARVKAGVMPSMETLNAEFGVSRREREYIEAQRAVVDQLDALRHLLQIETGTEIITTDAPPSDHPSISEAESVQRCLSRPDLLEQKRNLELALFETTLFDNRRKPDLSLDTAAGINTLDRNHVRDYGEIGPLDEVNWRVGLFFSYPIGNEDAENAYRKSLLKCEQLRLKIKTLEEKATNEVRAAFRAFQSSFKQIEVADRQVAFADKRFQAYLRKSEVGLATNKEVLDVENEFAGAKNDRLSALTAHADALTRLWRATGELLEQMGISVSETQARRLYETIP